MPIIRVKKRAPNKLVFASSIDQIINYYMSMATLMHLRILYKNWKMLSHNCIVLSYALFSPHFVLRLFLMITCNHHKHNNVFF